MISCAPFLVDPTPILDFLDMNYIIAHHVKMATRGDKNKKCDGYNKLKGDVVLQGADDMSCRSCEVANKRKLIQLALDRRMSTV